MILSLTHKIQISLFYSRPSFALTFLPSCFYLLCAFPCLSNLVSAVLSIRGSKEDKKKEDQSGDGSCVELFTLEEMDADWATSSIGNETIDQNSESVSELKWLSNWRERWKHPAAVSRTPNWKTQGSPRENTFLMLTLAHPIHPGALRGEKKSDLPSHGDSLAMMAYLRSGFNQKHSNCLNAQLLHSHSPWASSGRGDA